MEWNGYDYFDLMFSFDSTGFLEPWILTLFLSPCNTIKCAFVRTCSSLFILILILHLYTFVTMYGLGS